MHSEAPFDPISLTLAPDPRFARLVRMTAANVAALSSMSVERVEDIRIAAEEAFIFACNATSVDEVTFTFEVDGEHVALDVSLGDGPLPASATEGPAAYVDLILGAVCDSYEKVTTPARLHLELKADV